MASVLEGERGGRVDGTGEPMPVEKGPERRVIRRDGQRHRSRSVMRADKVGSATLLARIVAMVAQAQRQPGADSEAGRVVSGYFVPAVVAAAVVTRCGLAERRTGAAHRARDSSTPWRC
jgi:Cu+-exporting ATPase